MVLATLNKPLQLLFLTYSEQVSADELRNKRAAMEALLAELEPGFRMLANLRSLESMELDCVTELGQFMDSMNRHGVSLVVRVIADPTKDIGLNILSLFHYGHQVRTITCATLTEASRVLSI